MFIFKTRAYFYSNPNEISFITSFKTEIGGSPSHKITPSES
jgi:hypothetical protein